MQKEQEEERLQRLVQEEAVRFLWTQVSVFSSYRLRRSSRKRRLAMANGV